MSHEITRYQKCGGRRNSVYLHQDIRRHSVVEVTKFETYDKDFLL